MFLASLFIVSLHVKVKVKGQGRENTEIMFVGKFAAYDPIYFNGPI